MLPILYTPLLSIGHSTQSTSGETGSAVVMDLLLHKHHSLPEYRENISKLYQTNSHSFRLYHLLLFLLVYWLASPFISFFAPMPYRRNLRKIESLAESLVSSASVSKAHGRWSVGRLISSLIRSEKEEKFARSPLDSRSVELSFMTLLSDIADPRLISTPRMLMVHAPAPDIVFIFDELDKLGASSAAEEEKHTPVLENALTDRMRSEELHEMSVSYTHLTLPTICSV